MKNIHLISTDKPSRLFKDAFGKYFISINIDQEQNHFKPQHLYITNDEEIKEGDWVYCRTENRVLVSNVSYSKLEARFKIILTTDHDLIADGVQSIDDDFLEWFVKNPSCEEVEVNRIDLDAYANGVQDGVKWQKERSYSEEDMFKFSQWISHEDWVYLPSKDYWVNEEQEELEQKLSSKEILNLWFEQFKKK
jgi:hypothetical protein